MDYSTFLRKFTLFRENLKVDDSAFDYIFYTYGLELYGDMPLVEPLEYADERTISDFVIVIDTSASTQGKLVERFVQRTFDLLQESREIKNRFNIHLIQCDAAVQEDCILRTERMLYTGIWKHGAERSGRHGLSTGLPLYKQPGGTRRFRTFRACCTLPTERHFPAGNRPTTRHLF